MRLFYAISLPESIKKALSDLSARLCARSEQGRFTEPDNFHLTLAFLGEVPAERLEAVETAMRSVQCMPFELSFSGLGCFPRGQRGIWWVGVDPSEPLLRLHQHLAEAVRRAGFPLEDQPYRPHLTLGREIRLMPDADVTGMARTLPPLFMRVEAICLMESARVNGRLAYTPIRVHPLTPGTAR